MASLEIDLARIIELLTELGVEGRLQQRGDSCALISPRSGEILFTVTETRFARPTQREREYAASLGLNASATYVWARPASPNERALLAFRGEMDRLARTSSGSRTASETIERDLTRRANTCFNELGVDMEIVDGMLLCRGSELADVERAGDDALQVNTKTGSYRLPLADTPSGEWDDETLEAVQSLVDRFEPTVLEADALCRKASVLGLRLERKRYGLSTDRGLIPLVTDKPLFLVVAREVPDFLPLAAETYLLPLLDARRYSVAGSGERIEVRRDATRIAAAVGPRSADRGPARISGDFLSNGEWWADLASALEQAESSEAPGGPSVTSWSTVVVDLPEALRAACLEGSDNIRLHRTAAFGTPVTLALGAVEVTFDPVERFAGGHIVPFRFVDERHQTRGHLRLFGAGLLPMALEELTLAGSERIYVAVVLGFEALTVRPEFANYEVSVTTSSRRGGAGPPSGPRTATAAERRAPARPRVYASRTGVLEPLGSTRTAHWVAGHIRLLAPGSSASDEAIAAAGEVGIGLRSGETWVRPHVRGLGAEETLSFRWHAPAAVLAALRATEVETPGT